VGSASPQGGESFGASDLPAHLPSALNWQVLVVDDDSDTRDFLTTVLEKQGAKVTAVASGSEALEQSNSLSRMYW